MVFITSRKVRTCCRRGALQFLTTDYKNSPVPDFTKLSDVDIKKLNQAWKNYRDDFNVKKLDDVVLEVLGFKLEEQDNITKELDDLILKRTSTSSRNHS